MSIFLINISLKIDTVLSLLHDGYDIESKAVITSSTYWIHPKYNVYHKLSLYLLWGGLKWLKRLTLMCFLQSRKALEGLISKLLGEWGVWLHQMNTENSNVLLCFRSHRFRNVQVEVLYQRYFLRMNQNNMVSLLGLLICISLVLIVTNHLMYSSTHSSLLQVSCKKHQHIVWKLLKMSH